jgi:hypothetical protein
MTIHELAELIRKERDWEYEDGEKSVAFTVPTEGERRHRVRLTEFRHENVTFVRLTSTIGSAEALDPRRALSALGLNAHLAFGAIAIFRDELVLTASLPLGLIEWSAAMMTISYLAQQADRYEAAMFGDDTE